MEQSGLVEGKYNICKILQSNIQWNLYTIMHKDSGDKQCAHMKELVSGHVSVQMGQRLNTRYIFRESVDIKTEYLDCISQNNIS